MPEFHSIRAGKPGTAMLQARLILGSPKGARDPRGAPQCAPRGWAQQPGGLGSALAVSSPDESK